MTNAPRIVTPLPAGVANTQRIGAGLSIIAFPVMLLLGFLSHPNLLSFEIVTEYDAWVAEWRGNTLFHLGHLLVMAAVPLIIFALVWFMGQLRGRGARPGLIGGVLGIFGAAMLAVDKGALTLTLTAFQEIPDGAFAGIAPALQAMLDRSGWLWITWGYVALPIGTIILTIGLLRERVIARWQGISIIAGLLLLMNPDIEIISASGALLMCIGYVRWV